MFGSSVAPSYGGGAGGGAMQQQMLAMLAQALGLGPGTKAVGDPVNPYYTGPDGIFNLPGVNKEFISTVIQPTGLGSVLPSFGTVYNTPEFGYITGFSSATGTNPDGPCDDAKQAGPVITCLQTAHFGRYRLDSRTVEVNRIGLLRNNSDPTDLRLLNGPLVSMLGSMVQPSSGMGDSNAMFSPTGELAARMVEMAHEYGDILMQQVYRGDPTNHTNGGYDEFPGLDMLIGTTKLDSRTGSPCNALKSDIKNFNYGLVTQNGGQDVINALVNIVWTRKFIASRTNMGTVKWVFVMRENLFNELTKVWPCAYYTSGCQVQPNSQVQAVYNMTDNISLRDDMRAGRYLLIDGVRYDVVFDDAIDEDNASDNALIPVTGFASDIYFVPLTVKGNVPVTYWEYLDFSKGATIGLAAGHYNDGTFWTDAGKFLWWRKPNNNVCIQLGSKIEPRIIMLTPHLAGRLLNVSYNPLQHAPDAYSGQMYYERSGVENRPQGGLYSEWNPTTPGL